MSAIGPDLPPHLLAKRKRKQEEQAEDAPSTASGAKPSSSPDSGEKPQRVIGPSMPPAPLDERPEIPADEAESNSDDDDGFGPALPVNGVDGTNTSQQDETGDSAGTTAWPRGAKMQRDDWMMMPPKQDDLAARLDPTQRRPTKFNTSKGMKGPNQLGEDSSAWHETPEQKRKRLEDEMMGVSKPPAGGLAPSSRSTSEAKHDTAVLQMVQEHAEKPRGPSLLEKHKGRKDTEPEDDPSKRAFDREKDMGGAMRISSSQKREMLNKAADFSSKFSGGSYL